MEMQQLYQRNQQLAIPTTPNLDAVSIPTLPSPIAAQEAAAHAPPPPQPATGKKAGALAAAIVATTAAPKKKAFRSSQKIRFVIKPRDSDEDSRVVKVSVTDLSPDFEEGETRICNVIGQSDQHAVLAWRDASGNVRADISDLSMLPPKTLKQCKTATAMTGVGQEISSEIQTLAEEDFLKCGLRVPGGCVEGYVCTKKGSLFGKTCDATMAESLVLMATFWRQKNGLYMFRVRFEPLNTREPAEYLPLSDVDWLHPTQGRCRESPERLRECLHECLLGDSARRSFGNRTVAFKGAPSFMAAMMASSPQSEECAEALELTRLVVGAAGARDEVGNFIVCTNQQSAPWDEKSVHCLCHVELEGGVDRALVKKLDSRPRCLESKKYHAKSGGAKRSRGGGGNVKRTNTKKSMCAKEVVV